ncbi:MAG: response regulator [Paracoccus sp.]|nr:response regulator [Paracoccus sp. (in: a-proteobacteria)]
MILIVDDNPTNRFILAKMLESRGYTVSEATNGPAAIEWIRSNDPAAVLMDINMPGMSGVEAALEIKRLLGSQAPAIIAVTSDNTSVRQIECKDAGFGGFIPKPVRMQSLFEIINQHLTPRAAVDP